MNTALQRIVSLAGRPELVPGIERVHADCWPRFIIDGHCADGTDRLWEPLLDRFAEFQLVMLDESGEILAAGHTIPLRWDGTPGDLPDGWAAGLLRGFEEADNNAEPNALMASSMSVSPAARQRGISTAMLRAMRQLAADRGWASMIAPVRPSWKDRYPLTPIERYVEWTTPAGQPFDPWIRAHRRLGAQPMGIAHRSMSIIGAVAEWEGWTGLPFPESGPYVVPSALVPVTIDRKTNLGRYDEPNFWMRHSTR